MIFDSFNYEVVTLETVEITDEIRTGFLGQNKNKVTYRFQNQKKIVKTAKQYIENLGNGIHLEMVDIPGGTFIMGAPTSEEDSRENERPQHKVKLQPFLMGKYSVTQEVWRTVAGFPAVERELAPNPSRFKGDKRPVENVSWYDAVEFCQRLSRQTQRQYRLPSEAEWEYACRAGTKTPFHFGETITTDVANYDGNSIYGAGVKGIYRQETTDVGSFGITNAFGLYDMHGNVWEWCTDYWHDNYQNAPIDGSAWIAGEKSDRRLLRGGSWYGDSLDCRSAFRLRGDPESRCEIIGFRVVCAA